MTERNPMIVVLARTFNSARDYMQRNHPGHPYRDTVVITNHEDVYRWLAGLELRRGVDIVEEASIIPLHHSEILAMVESRFRR